MSEYLPLIHMCVTISALGGAWSAVRKVARDAETQKKHHTAEILQSAKEADHALKLRLENRIEKLEVELKTLEESVKKDITHLKESSASEFKALSEKIERLRDDLRSQSNSILDLLTKMIDK